MRAKLLLTNMKTKKLTYEQLILKLLESEPRWFWSYELVSRHVDGEWLGPSADRIARYMAEEGKIERKGRQEHSGKYAQYRAIQGEETPKIAYAILPRIIPTLPEKTLDLFANLV